MYEEKDKTEPMTAVKKPKYVGPVEYRSKKRNFTIRMRSMHRTIVDGRPQLTYGKRAQFMNHQLITEDAETIEFLDGLLTGRGAVKWRRLFVRAPGQAAQRAMIRAAQEARKAEDEILKKSLTTEERKEITDFNEFVQKQKTKLNTSAVGVRMGG